MIDIAGGGKSCRWWSVSLMEDDYHGPWALVSRIVPFDEIGVWFRELDEGSLLGMRLYEKSTNTHPEYAFLHWASMTEIERYFLPAPYHLSKHSTGLLHVWYLEEGGKWVSRCGRLRPRTTKPEGHNRYTEGDLDSTCEICGVDMMRHFREKR